MAITVAEVQAMVQRHYPDISQALFLDLFNQAHGEILTTVRLLPDVPITISLTAGTAEYALPDTVLHVLEAAIGSSSLVCSSIEDLDERTRNWRTATSAPSTTYYLNGNHIGLYPSPDTITAGNSLTVWVSQQPTALGSGDSLPGLVIVPNAWVYRVLAKFALMLHREESQLMMQVSEQALGELKHYIQMRASRLRPMNPPQQKGEK